MKDREFKKTMDTLCTVEKRRVNGKTHTIKTFSPELIAKASNELKNRLIGHLVKLRAPIVLNLLNPETDTSWLNSMGYFYPKQGKVFNFLCTCENQYEVK